RSTHLDSNPFQKLGRLLPADQRKHKVVCKPGLFLLAPHVHQNHFGWGDLLDLGSEENLYLPRVDAIIDVHLVSKLEIALEIAADDQGHLVVASEGDPLAVALKPCKVDGSFNRRIPCPDYYALLAYVIVRIRELELNLPGFIGLLRFRGVRCAADPAKLRRAFARRSAARTVLWKHRRRSHHDFKLLAGHP